MTETTNETMTETIETNEKTLTAYAAANLVNALLKEDGVLTSAGEQRTVQPQMLYNYVSKGTLPSVERVKPNGKTQKVIRLEDLAVWYAEYRDKLLNQGGGVSTQELVDEVRELIAE